MVHGRQPPWRRPFPHWTDPYHGKVSYPSETTIRQLAHHTENEIVALIVVVFVSGCILRSLLRTSMKVFHHWSVLRGPHDRLVLGHYNLSHNRALDDCSGCRMIGKCRGRHGLDFDFDSVTDDG